MRDQDALKKAASAKETSLREELAKARVRRPEREDLEFLYFVAQLVDQKWQRGQAVPEGSVRESLVGDVREFMIK